MRLKISDYLVTGSHGNTLFIDLSGPLGKAKRLSSFKIHSLISQSDETKKEKRKHLFFYC